MRRRRQVQLELPFKSWGGPRKGAGLAVGELGRSLALQMYPAIPFQAPWWALLAAPATAVITAVLFTLAPARRAARLDPVQALSRR